VLAVQAERIQPIGVPRDVGMVPRRVLLGDAADRSAQVAGDERYLEAELSDREL
jgi:hypothetical protein